jgi:hypothetical protein
MLYNDSNNWLKFTQHILKYEGGLSKRASDESASKCVQAGQFHTNKGVTFCTFKERADKLGISPVTYERFLNLTDEDVAKFIYAYYNGVNGSSYPDSIALAMTEASWGGGPVFAQLYKALSNLGQPVSTKKDSIIAVDKLPERMVFDEFIKIRKQYLQTLMLSPKYSMNVGWIPRLQSFYDNFNPDVIGSKKKLTLVLLFPILLVISFLIFKKSK